MKADLFLATHSVFTRDELAGALRSRGRAEATIASHLARWTRQGRVTRVKRGLFVRAGEPVDYPALASRMAPDAAVAYHTALEVHGYAQSVFERLTFVTCTGAKPTTFEGRRFVPVRPRAALRPHDRGDRWIEWVERAGVEIRVTDLERTVVDVLDRPDLAGGVEEVWRSLASVPALDPVSLDLYVTLLGGRTLAAKVGFFLESRREDLVVPTAVLERLQARVPRSPVFMDRRRKGRLVSRWALIVPQEVQVELEGGRIRPGVQAVRNRSWR